MVKILSFRLRLSHFGMVHILLGFFHPRGFTESSSRIHKMHLLPTHQVCKFPLFPTTPMFNFMCSSRNLPHFKVSLGASLPNYRLRSRRFSSVAPNALSNSSNKHSIAVSYLINSCGLSPEEALSASNIINIKTTEKPNSVLAFLKKHNFTQTQISRTVKRYPDILFCNPEETLLPKFRFLGSIGLSNTDIARGLTMKPKVWTCSFEKQMIPAYNFYRQWLQYDEKTVSAIKLCPLVLFYNPQTSVVPNIRYLKEIGMPDSNIMSFFRENPRCFLSTAKFRTISEKVKRMGFDPSVMKFIGAFNVLVAMGKPTWQRKIEVYKKWGFSEDDISLAFKRCPKFMMASEEKIMGIMGILVKNIGLKASVIANRPQIFTLNMEKTIVPRCLVYEALVKRGLFEKNQDNHLLNLLCVTESRFIEGTIKPHDEKFPKLVKLYQEKVEKAKQLKS